MGVELKGLKFDDGKPTFELLPDDALAAIQKVLDFGANKYAARNWELGMEWRRPWNACLRHLWAWMRRQKADPETGMSHLWHAGCCILFLIAFELRGVGVDDRPVAAKDTNTQDPPNPQDTRDTYSVIPITPYLAK